MSALYILIPISFFMALGGFLAFVWSVKSGQFDDLGGEAQRSLFDRRESGVDNFKHGGKQ